MLVLYLVQQEELWKQLLRTAYYLVTNENPDPDAFKEVRGRESWKEASFDLAGANIRVAIASGLGNTRS